MFLLVFFFKQKTAYEMRISDWSSDVCSSDLQTRAAHRQRLRREQFVGDVAGVVAIAEADRDVAAIEQVAALIVLAACAIDQRLPRRDAQINVSVSLAERLQLRNPPFGPQRLRPGYANTTGVHGLLGRCDPMCRVRG